MRYPRLFQSTTSPAHSTRSLERRLTGRMAPATMPMALAARMAPATMLTLAITATLAPIAVAQTIVDVLPTTNGAWGLEYHDGFLWVGDDTDGFIKKVDPADGTILETLPTPYDENTISFGANHGVAWDGSGFWVAGDFGKDFLYKVSPAGAFVDTIPTPTDAVGGLSFDGTNLLVTSYFPNAEAGILIVDPADGSILGSTIPTQGDQPFGIDYDPMDGNYWNGMDDNDGDAERIYNLSSVDGSVISFFDSPNQSPKGLALGDGFLWLIANTIEGSGRSIFKIDLSGAGTPDIDPVPSEQDFGIVAIGSTGSVSQRLVNEGDGDLTITDVSTFSPFSTEALLLPATITPGQELVFDVFFDPATAGNFQANLNVISNDVDEGDLDIVLTGIGVPADQTIQVSGSLDFVDTGVGLLRSRTVTIQNRGFADLQVSSVTSDLPQFELVDLPEIPISLSTFESIEAEVLFRPDGVSSFATDIEITSDDPAQPLVAVAASGDGFDAVFAPGEPIWSAEGIENVVTLLGGADLGGVDLTGDGVPDAVMESYDAGADGDPLQTFYGNSHGDGIDYWKRADGRSGGWGDQGLAYGSDLDDDGVPEIIRGTAWGGKRVEVWNGTTGQLIWDYDTRNEDNGGWVYSVAAMPDVSGDGIREVLAAAGTDGEPFSGARRIYCFDGATGDIRFTRVGPDGFLTVSWIEDVNMDGNPDVIGGGGGNSADDLVYCLSGASTGNATTLWTFPTGGSVWSVARIADVNGDGINDVLAGSWSNTVFCLDGTDGSEIWSHVTAGDVIRVEATPDLTGDGVEDVVVAEIGNFVRVLDGSDGTLHWFYVTGGNVWSATSIPDVDGDSVADIIAGAQSDIVFCISGATGSLFWQTNVGALVYSVRAIPDVNGNGSYDVIAGTQDLGGPGEGKIWCLEGSGAVVSIPEIPQQIDADAFDVLRVAPNPVTDWATFQFRSGDRVEGTVELDIYDANGRRVRSYRQAATPGFGQIVWDGRFENGERVSSGVYFYRLQGPMLNAVEGNITILR